MTTRINLLPVRASKKKETAKQQIAILVITLVAVLAAGLFAYTIIIAKISAAKNEVTQTEGEIQQLKAKIGEIDNIKKLEDEVRKKLDVLNQLRKGKSGPVKRLAALSDSTPEKVWLTKYAETGQDVSISGFAYNDDLIAQFIHNLETSGEFFGVELQVTEQAEIGGVKVKRFDLTCKLSPVKKEPPKAPGK